MAIKSYLVSRGRTLSVMPTYACNARCSNCGTVSSPNDTNVLSRERIVEAISEAKELGFANVVFTGGEATLRPADLLAGIAHATRLGLPTRLVTNAHWAVNDDVAKAFVHELVESGLGEINFSTGAEHVKFIPLQTVVTAICAAVAFGLRVAVMIELRLPQQISRRDVESTPAYDRLAPEQKANVAFIESPWMPLSPSRTYEYPPGAVVNRENVASTTGCDSVLQTYVLQADGRIGACCGLGMRVIPELSVGTVAQPRYLERAVEDAEGDALKLLLRFLGPEKILAWAQTKDATIEWEDRYAHRCQACLRVYRDPAVAAALRASYGELLPRAIQGAWLEEVAIPQVWQEASM